MLSRNEHRTFRTSVLFLILSYLSTNKTDRVWNQSISDLPNLDPEFESQTIFTEASIVLIEAGLIRETGLTLL
jgi:hypothetical protein